MADNNTPYNFTSHDGVDENEVRAEVHVQVNKGTIKEIKENPASGVADVHFSVEKLKFPIHGWIRTDDPVYEKVTKARDTSSEVSFRIETQRKAGVDRKTPIAEFRGDTTTARENTKVLLVGINGDLTDEAVTNPKADPHSTGGRYKAGDESPAVPSSSTTGGITLDEDTILANLATAATNPLVRQPVLDHLAAQAIFNGIDVTKVNTALGGADKRDNSQPTEAPRAAIAQEAPVWKEYNTDGRLNLGSSLVMAGVGIESLVYKKLAEKDALGASNVGVVLDYFTTLVFAISDFIQTGAYGENARPDRAAGSHSRIRGIVYDVIDKKASLPVTVFDVQGENLILVNDPTDIQNWIKLVGSESRTRFLRAIKAAQEYPRFGEITPPASLFLNRVAPQQQTRPVSTPITPSVTPVVEPVVPTSPAVQNDQNARINAARSIVDSVPDLPESEVALPITPKGAQEATVAPTSGPEGNDTPVTPEVVEEQTSGFEGVLAPVKLPENDPREKATPDTVAELQNLLAESGFDLEDKADLVRISKLLTYTFGSSNAKKIADEEIVNFIDHYIAAGTEGLQNAIRIAVGRD